MTMRAQSAPILLGIISAALILCDIYSGLSPFPSHLNFLYLANVIIFPTSIALLAFSRKTPHRKLWIGGLLILATVSIPHYTYSKFGMSIYLKSHAAQYSSITKFMSENDISAFSKMQTIPDSSNSCKISIMSKKGKIDTLCPNNSNTKMALFLNSINAANISYGRTMNGGFELKLYGLKRARLWVIESKSRTKNNLHSDGYIIISKNLYCHFPKLQPD